MPARIRCWRVGVSASRWALGTRRNASITTEQLIDALAPLRGSGIPLTVHMRQEGSGVVAALEEMLTVARALQTPLEISHLKAIGRVNWRAAVPQMLAMMESAREDGVDVACDVYPYTAGSTQLIHVLPPECQTGGLEQLSERLGDAAFRAQLRERMQTGEDFENISLLAGWENIRIAALAGAEDQKYVGQSIAALAEKERKDPFDALFDLLAREHCAVTMIDEIACEDDLEAILRDGHSSIISDSIYPGLRTLPSARVRYVRPCDRALCPRTRRADAGGGRREDDRSARRAAWPPDEGKAHSRA